MKESEIKKALSLVPNFIKVAENDLGEDNHSDAKDMTCEEFDLIMALQIKLTNCVNYVDTLIFK